MQTHPTTDPATERQRCALGSNSTKTIADFRSRPDDLFSTDDLASAGIVRSRSSLRRAVQNGKLPAPVRLPSNRLAWRGEVLAEWYDGLEHRARRVASEPIKAAA